MQFPSTPPTIFNLNYLNYLSCECNQFNYFDYETRTVHGSIMVRDTCGCCSYPEDASWEWDQLTEDEQRELIEHLYPNAQES